MYFDFDEYAHLRRYLGLAGEDEDVDIDLEIPTLDGMNDNTMPTPSVNGTYIAAPEISDGSDCDGEDKHNGKTVTSKVKKISRASFTAKPLTFLQEWLAGCVRRRGQDFVRTPMGSVCQAKPLKASHPFFVKRNEVDRAQDGTGKATMGYNISKSAYVNAPPEADDHDSEGSVDDEINWDEDMDDGDDHNTIVTKTVCQLQ